MACLFLPKDATGHIKKSLHFPSAVLLVTGLLCLPFSLNELQRLGLRDPLVYSALLIGIVVLGLFGYLQPRIRQPFLDLKFFKNRALLSCFLVRFLW